MRSGAERILAALPSVTGATVAPPQPNREMLAVVADAQARAKELGDEYLSTEHLLLGIAAKGGAAGEVLEGREPVRRSCRRPSARRGEGAA